MRSAIRKARLAHPLVMPFDGYIIHQHIDPRSPLDDAAAEAVCEMLLGEPEHHLLERG